MVERMMAKTTPNGECLEWTGSLNRKSGYGEVRINTNRKEYAHRLMFRLTRGWIPPGEVVMHDCDNPKCVNPAHLRTGTQLDNLRDAQRKGRMPQWNRR
jgi:hypothetical protein